MSIHHHLVFLPIKFVYLTSDKLVRHCYNRFNTDFNPFSISYINELVSHARMTKLLAVINDPAFGWYPKWINPDESVQQKNE